MFRSPRPYRTIAALVAAVLLAPMAAQAMRPVPARPLVELEVVDRDHGDATPAYVHRGERWIAGRPGTPYAVRLTNTSGARVLVVLSVDGVNAVTGQTASPSQTGYVLAPWQSTEITGWRKSQADVARFEFTALPESYAARTGRPDNVGTIGIAVFRERVVPPPPTRAAPPAIARSSTSAERARSADAAVARESAMVQQIGTGHGAREWSPVSNTAFERATRHPAQVTTLRYDTPQALAAMGIGPRWSPRPAPHRPQAFPSGFVPGP